MDSIEENDVLVAAKSVLHRSHFKGRKSFVITFRGVFCVTTTIAVELWALLGSNKPKGSKYCHLPWGLKFLRGYNTESSNAASVDVHKRTFRRWQWIFVSVIADLKTVSE